METFVFLTLLIREIVLSTISSHEQAQIIRCEMNFLLSCIIMMMTRSFDCALLCQWHYKRLNLIHEKSLPQKIALFEGIRLQQEISQSSVPLISFILIKSYLRVRFSRAFLGEFTVNKKSLRINQKHFLIETVIFDRHPFFFPFFIL